MEGKNMLSVLIDIAIMVAQVFALTVVVLAFIGVIVFGMRDAMGYNDF